VRIVAAENQVAFGIRDPRLLVSDDDVADHLRVYLQRAGSRAEGRVGPAQAAPRSGASCLGAASPKTACGFGHAAYERARSALSIRPFPIAQACGPRRTR